LGSRRSVEALILEGKVQVNGETVSDLATKVVPSDRVTCAGKSITSAAHRYIAFHKPRGCVCSQEDPHADKTIYDFLPREFAPLQYGGRLDSDSEGLLLLSNDGEWLHLITHPRFEVIKRYTVEVKGVPTHEKLKEACKGVTDEGERLKFHAARILSAGSGRATVEVDLKEGKKREIRRVLKQLGHSVTRLKRIQVGKVRIHGMVPGEWRELTPQEVASFRKGDHPKAKTR
jgi:23S rRNA pseudouridine2605 synthase